MKKNNLYLQLMIGMLAFITSCQKEKNPQPGNSFLVNNSNTEVQTATNSAHISDIPLTLTIFNPCCRESILLTGTIHRVENSNVIHMDDHDISGVGLTTGVTYTVQSSSVRNYVFDSNDYLATLNWSIRMMSETGCGYNVQFVVHVTRDEDGKIRASIHSGNFFCL